MAHCPRCGEGALFDGFLGLRERCDRCGLSYGFADAGDGPAFFVVIFAGALVVIGALWLEVAVSPPYWVHAVIWVPLTLVLCLAPLRPIKALMIRQQYARDAREGRRDRPRGET